MRGHYLAEAETGWDFTPRFSGRCLDHNPADLNGLLHTYETILGAHAEALGWDNTALWQERAATRRERMNRLLWSDARGWWRFAINYGFKMERRGGMV